MIEFLIEGSGEFPPVPSSDPFPPPVSDRDDGMSSQLLPDLPVEALGIVSLVQNIGPGSPGAVTSPQERPGMDDIMGEVLGYPDPGDHLFTGIYRHRCLQIAPPGGSGPPGIVGDGIGAQETEESMAVTGITSPRR